MSSWLQFRKLSEEIFQPISAAILCGPKIWRQTLRSQNMPARGGFCPSRSFSAAFSLSNLLFRREPFQNCQQRTKCSKIVNGELNAQKASTLNKMLKMCKKKSPSCMLTVMESASPKACLITILCWEASLVSTCFGGILISTCFRFGLSCCWLHSL